MYQKLLIIGNLGRDPELKYSVEGKPIDGGLSAAMIIALRYTQKNFGKLPTSSTS